MPVHLRIESEEAASVQAAVREGLRLNDPDHLPRRDYQPLCLSLRSESNTVLGGLFGGTMWSWLMIDGLWVTEELRGRGHGLRLLTEAESEALRQGCVGSWLGTFDFQAKDFYERHGYTVFAELQGFPRGHSHYHLRKALVAAAASPA